MVCPHNDTAVLTILKGLISETLLTILFIIVIVLVPILLIVYLVHLIAPTQARRASEKKQAHSTSANIALAAVAAIHATTAINQHTLDTLLQTLSNYIAVIEPTIFVTMPCAHIQTFSLVAPILSSPHSSHDATTPIFCFCGDDDIARQE